MEIAHPDLVANWATPSQLFQLSLPSQRTADAAGKVPGTAILWSHALQVDEGSRKSLI